MPTSIFPSQNTWITPRTDLGQLDTSNCKIILNQKIDNIGKILVNAVSNEFSFLITLGTANYRVPFYDIYSDEACTHKIFDIVDISKYVVEKAKYSTLNKITVWQDELPSEGKLYLANTWCYAHNENEIIMPNNVYSISQETPDLIMVWCLFDLFNKYPTIYMKIYDDGSHLIFTRDVLQAYKVTAKIPDLRKWQFRVYYTPLGESVKLQVPKTNPQVNQFCIPYSQQQPIVDNTTLGREMQSVANRAGCEKKEVVRTCHSFKDVYKIGTIWRERDRIGNFTGNVWRLTGQRLNIYSETHIIVTETWSKNWSYRSENVPINREFRSWNIPADIVQRNLLWQDYCLISRKSLSDSELPDTSILSDDAKRELMRGLKSMDTGYKTECNNMWFYTNYGGVALSCSSFGFGNSLVFSGKTKDNLSAGVQRVDSENNGKYEFCKDVYYCNDDGTLDEMYIQIGAALYSDPEYADEAAYLYPEYQHIVKQTITPEEVKREVLYINGPAPTSKSKGLLLFKQTESDKTWNLFEVLKDPCEQLNFTYQLHLLTDDGMLVIGSTWAATNPLVKQRDKAATIKVWKLTQPLPQGAQVMTTSYGTELQSSLFSVVLSNNTITFNPYGTTNDGVGVCVTDEHDNVLIAFNSNEPATFFVKFTHDYDAIAKALKNN